MTDKATEGQGAVPGSAPLDGGVRPAVWWREQRDAFEGPQTLAPMYLRGPEKPGRDDSGATYEPLYDSAALEAVRAAERERLCAELSLAMQHSAWASVLQLDDAMRNIGDALVQGPNAGVKRVLPAKEDR